VVDRRVAIFDVASHLARAQYMLLSNREKAKLHCDGNEKKKSEKGLRYGERKCLSSEKKKNINYILLK